MDFIRSHRLEKDQEGYTVILFLDQNFTEFSSELGTDNMNSSKTNENMKDYVADRYPNKKVNTIKVFLGSILVMTLAFANETEVSASTKAPLPNKLTAIEDPSTYSVKSGDSLFKIAQTYNTSVDLIKQKNNLSANTIYIGQVLSIPTQKNIEIETISYQVKPGDTLSQIAKRHRTTTDEIKQINQLSSDMIYVTQMLQIPSSTGQQSSPDLSSTHQVTAGDTLSGLAKQYHATVSQIKQLNNLLSDLIYTGQSLKMPRVSSNQIPTVQSNYTVVSGDTLSGIAKQYNISVAELKLTNNLISDTIYIGQQIQLPMGGVDGISSPPNLEQINTQLESVQANLKILGFYNGDVTGVDDTNTVRAITAFQQAYQLPITGKVNSSTQQELENAVIKQDLVNDMSNYTGVPYVWGGTNPSGFDCSGFVYFMFNQHDVEMTRSTSSSLYHTGTSISKNNLQPGDLVFFAVNQPGTISHVGFYTGENSFVSATSSKGIWEYDMDNAYWSNYYEGAKRVF
ncbi:C40 family peptidase [Paraliobacillus zengyii]|uniref:C40 family peptidase n=1 Tax=Paraliobacillus zengyii TaxID=2213194 RepID=UPI000DD4B749|nr:LysM peptidoglycan-binding domain-containing protein [Paraliobacillus zengyii]